MSEVNRPVLYIVEGEKDERRLIENTWRVLDSGPTRTYHSYRTNLHVLIDLLFDENSDLDEDLDLVRTLMFEEEDIERKKILNKKYTDVFIIFDLEVQDRKYDEHTSEIKKMLEHFNDSTDAGKLYINYPMVESYRHMSSLADVDFRSRIVTRGDCSEYKRIVGRESFLKDTSKCDPDMMRAIISMHLKKYNFICTETWELPTKEEFLEWDGSTLFSIQCSKIKGCDSMYVLNTCILNVVEYNPSAFLG